MNRLNEVHGGESVSISGYKRKFYNFYLKFASLSRPFIAKGSIFYANTRIHDTSRINGKLIAKGLGTISIGKYCAIGWDVRIITSNHNSKCLNLSISLQNELRLPTYEQAGDVLIGHNVWIGDSVIILPSVTIGNGAIIGAGSVVTKNVPAYSIYAGNPARLIRKRFSDEMYERIENLAWWDLPQHEMQSLISYFDREQFENQGNVI